MAKAGIYTILKFIASSGYPKNIISLQNYYDYSWYGRTIYNSNWNSLLSLRTHTITVP